MLKVSMVYFSEEVSSSTVEALLFSPAEHNLVITGSLEGMLSVWDLSSQVSKFW